MTTVTFAGRQIDLAKALPLRLKDYRTLERAGINADQAISAIAEGKVEGLFQVTLHILRQADPTVTEAELDVLTPDELRDLWTRIGEIGAALKAAEVPFGGSSMSSGASTTGAPAPS